MDLKRENPVCLKASKSEENLKICVSHHSTESIGVLQNWEKMANIENGDGVAKLVHIQIKVLNFYKFYGKVGVMIFWLLFQLTFFCKNFLPGICKDKSRFWCRSRWTTETNCKKNWYKKNCKKSCKLCPSQSKAKSNEFKLSILCTI